VKNKTENWTDACKQ